MRCSMRETHFGISRSDRRNDKQDGGYHQAAFAPQRRSHDTSDHTAQHAADQRTRHGKPQQRAGRRLTQAERRNEIQIEVLHRSRDHRGIVAEKQTAECRYQCQEHQVAVIFIHSGMF